MDITRNELLREDEELTKKLTDPAVAKDPRKLAEMAKRKKEVSALLEVFEGIAAEEEKITELRTFIDREGDESLKTLAREELAEHTERLKRHREKLKALSVPSDPRDAKNVIMEIRAGAGGDEATLFASELYGMYQHYAESQGWKVEVLSTSPSEVKGMKEIIFAISGNNVFAQLKYEAGTHRVQRIPVTESGGRIHTSTVTVAVLPEAEEVEIAIKPEEIRIDVFRSSGPGGQSVNTTDSAVRITHLPTGLVVSCQDEKSQHKNRAKALSILRARLLAKQEEEAAQARGEARREQVGSGDRSEKIRTYNFPQDRLTDHRIGYTRRGLAKVLAGDLAPVLVALKEADQSD